ncbi:MAG: GIY-YIG nuclease family protein [Candidatus Levybacteria bacterium]|nr:GIY-YIG nuclease family protein [Candidatus Levybacteria bacterium]
MIQKPKKKNWYIYMIKCADQTLYTGITTDVSKRIQAHNGEVKGGARYTRFKRPVTLVYQEESTDRSSASIREYQIKKLSREEKMKLITTPI